MSSSNRFVFIKKETIIPMFLFVLGTISMFLFFKQDFGTGIFLILFAFLLYSVHVYITRYTVESVFEQYLEEIASFYVFSFTTVIFGLFYFKGEMFFLFLIIVYLLLQVFASTRNTTLLYKHSQGWPIPLNAITFSFTYYLIVVVFPLFAHALFLVYYLATGILSIIDKNFIRDIKE